MTRVSWMWKWRKDDSLEHDKERQYGICQDTTQKKWTNILQFHADYDLMLDTTLGTTNLLYCLKFTHSAGGYLSPDIWMAMRKVEEPNIFEWVGLVFDRKKILNADVYGRQNVVLR